MGYNHGGKMDRDLKRSIAFFAFKYAIDFPDDFVDALEEYLTKEGFDLECIVQFNKEYLEKFREEQDARTH